MIKLHFSALLASKDLFSLLTSVTSVITIIDTMSTYTATVIKTGNSVALRVPKQYAQDAQLTPGEKVRLSLPTKLKQQDHTKIKNLIEKLQKIRAYASIKDPAKWQHEIRQDRPLLKK